MLRDYRCHRYATRIMEIARVLHVAESVETSLARQIAQDYMSRTAPTPGECFARPDHIPAVLTSTMGPAPLSVWEEDETLAKDLLDRLGVAPTMEMGMALYTATLCRHAGMSDCEESRVAQRRALPDGMSLGDLLVGFVEDEDPLEVVAQA